MRRAVAHCLRLLALLLCLGLGAQVPVPELTARVQDQTATLAPYEHKQLEQMLAAYETRHGTQFAILIVPTTAPETIEQYAIRVVDAWKLGRKRIDDGVLLLIAKDDRAMRIEVGRGLEGAIPDVLAKRIIAETMTPLFQAGDFTGGITAGVRQMMRLADGEMLPPPTTAPAPPEFLLPLFIFFGMLLRLLLRPPVAGLVSGGAAFALLLLLGVSVLTGLFWGALIAVLVMLMSASGGGGYYPRSGSGFGGGSAFRGGGGGFSGGGASGRW